MRMKSFAAAAALACMAVSAPALAQEATISVGATVYGPQGGTVGTVEQVEGGNVVVNTGSMTATLPAASFAQGENGPVIAWNKADLEAAIAAANQEAEAALAAALVTGAQLYSADGVVVGSVTEITPAGMVVVEHTTAGPIRLQKEQLAAQNGQLTVLTTAAALESAVAAQATAAPATATATAETGAAAEATTGTAAAETATAETATPATGM